MDMSQYLDTFLEESRDHMQNVNDMLLALEENPQDTRVLDEIFRSAHTLKGMSATMGYTQVAELTHQMENMLHKLRNGEMSVTSTIIDVLLRCLDGLENMMGAIADGVESDFDIQPLIAELTGQPRAVEEADKQQAPAASGAQGPVDSSVVFNEFEKHVLLEAQERGLHAWHIVVSIAPSCVMKSARSFMVFKNLEPLGEIIKTCPEVTDIEDEKFDTQFELVLLSGADQTDIFKAIANIAEVEEPILTEIDPLQATCRSALASPPPSKDQGESTGQPKKEGSDEGNKNNLVTHRGKSTSTIRVDIERLDSLMNLVGELVINKTSLTQIGRTARNSALGESLEQLDRISIDLQNLVMKVRMVPIEQVFNRFPRMVRDLARSLGKDLELVIEGKATELDRTVIDEIGDPLVHLLRNSIDHGVESPEERIAVGKPAKAAVRLAAKHEGNHVIIEVEDDGKGIDAAKIRSKAVEKGLLTQEEADSLSNQKAVEYIFAPGFSTAEKVSDVSGRGVGLDAVRNKIESLSGVCAIHTEVGQGTKFSIYLPLTLAIIQALLVKVATETYAIPLSFIDETTSITPEMIRIVQGQEIMMLRGNVLPLVRLHTPLDLETPQYEEDTELFVVVVRRGGKVLGLVVEDLIGQQEIVIKSLGELLGGIQGIAGAAIMGDGHVALILDVTSLV